MNLVFTILGIIFGSLIIMFTLGTLVSLVASKLADRDLEDIERKVRERSRNRK
jgi:hypothetical protein